MTKTTNLGRPKLPESERQKYQRVALYPETHELAKALAAKAGPNGAGINMIDWFDTLVKEAAMPSTEIELTPEESVPTKTKKKFPFFKN